MTLTLPNTNSTVGKVFKVLNFANNFLGDFLDFNIPIPATGDYLAESLTASGLSFTVTQDPSSNASIQPASLPVVNVGPKTRIRGRPSR